MIHRSLVTDSATAPPVTTWCPMPMPSDQSAKSWVSPGTRGGAWAVCERQGGSGDAPESGLARRYRRVPFQITPSPESGRYRPAALLARHYVAAARAACCWRRKPGEGGRSNGFGSDHRGGVRFTAPYGRDCLLYTSPS